MSAIPSDWRAAKELLRKTASSVLDKTAALDVQAFIQQKRLASDRSDTSTSHVPAAMSQQALDVCQESQSLPLRSLLTSCILVLLSLMLGWLCGVRQERWHQAMLRAQAADQETEELANISLTASVPSASSQLSSTAIVTPTHVTAQEKHYKNTLMQQPEAEHALTQSKQATALAPSHESVQQTFLQPVLQTEQTTPVPDQAVQQTSQHAAATAEAKQSSCSAAADSAAADSAASGHQRAAAQQSQDADEQSSSAMALPFTTAAQTLDGPIESAAGMCIATRSRCRQSFMTV